MSLDALGGLRVLEESVIINAMEGHGAFSNLVSGLDANEKKRLLEKLKMRTVLSDEPLIEPEAIGKEEKTETKYAKLSWYQRIWCWIVGLLSGRKPLEVYTNRQIEQASRRADLLYPGMYDYRLDFLRGEFYRELSNLKEAARFFYTMLDASVNRDKGAFTSYLASLSLPQMHDALIENTDPDLLASQNQGVSDTKLRQIAMEYIEQEMNKIPEDVHTSLYNDSRTLCCLKALSSFLFDRMLVAFKKAEGGDMSCKAAILKTQLMSLANILFSMRQVPSMSLLSSIYVFNMQGYQDVEDFDEDKEMQKFIDKAEKSIGVIRAFNRHVPLVMIIRCATRDLTWEPSELPGGEDWYSVFKNYWITTTRSSFAEWIHDRRTRRLETGLQSYFAGAIMDPLEYAESPENPGGPPVEMSLALSFLKLFHKKVFMPQINVIIRPILINGEFCKPENRAEFTESYNVLIKLDDTIKSFEINLSPAGDIGKRWSQTTGEVQSITIRRRKVHTVKEEISENSHNILEGTYDALVSMENVLNGIMRGTGSGTAKYDTLINLAKIRGKGTQFMDGLELAIQNIHQAVELLNDMKLLDNEDNA